MENAIIIVVLIILAGLAAWYICKAKKSGKTCIGCPHAKDCNKRCPSNKETNDA